ncbi:MAG: hypothetical protein NWE95_13470 [Candidatus Bathyarchaeota archaeon]|nr:hypothetical protein [Candidatus Bathyarchaeota archaeon]
MEISDKRLSAFLSITQGVGIVFLAFFLVAYLGGLPTTTVYHNELVFRIPLFALGAVLLELILCTIVVAVLAKKS